MPKGKTLTLKQKRFVKEYVKSGNATQAIVEAGYQVKDDDVARVMGTENLAKPTVRDAVDSALVALNLTPEWILGKHKNIIERNEKKDGMIAERGLENIGKIAGLYPSKLHKPRAFRWQVISELGELGLSIPLHASHNIHKTTHE